MAQQIAITVFDGAGTPVSHSLTAMGAYRHPDKPNVMIAKWAEITYAGSTEAQVRLTITHETLKSGVVRVERKLEVPVMEVVTGANAQGYSAAPKVAYIDTDLRVMYHHPRSTVAGRRLIRQMGNNLDGNISISVTPVTTGAVPELLDQQVMPT